MSRVLVVSHYYDPEPLPKAGELARALSARGHDVRVVAGIPNYPAGTLYPGFRQTTRRRGYRDGVRITRTFELPYHGRSSVGRLANYASTMVSMSFGGTPGWKPDAVYAWAPPPTTILPARILARGGGRGRRMGPRAPVVVDVQDLWPDFGVLAGLLDPGPKLEALRLIERLSYRGADRIVVPTEGYAANLRAKGVPDDRLVVLGNWVEDEAVLPADREAAASVRRAEGWDDRFVVLFAGNLGDAQGLDTVLDAAHKSDPSRIHWALAGDGADRPRLQAETTRRGLDDRVQFLGRRHPSTMPALAAAADALLVHLRPSPLADLVVPTKVNGYLAYGRPVLCALEGAAGTLVRRAGAGVTAPPGDATAIVDAARQLQEMPSTERERLGRSGRAYAEQHLTKSALIGRYEEVLGIDGAGES